MTQSTTSAKLAHLNLPPAERSIGLAVGRDLKVGWKKSELCACGEKWPLVVIQQISWKAVCELEPSGNQTAAKLAASPEDANSLAAIKIKSFAGPAHCWPWLSSSSSSMVEVAFAIDFGD